MQINNTTAPLGTIVCGETPLFIQNNDDSVWSTPDYQRYFIWKLDKQMLLIDSLINGFPIPAIVLVQRLAISSSGTPRVFWDIQDGQQRLTTMYRFVHNEFKITIDTDNLYYNELPETVRMRLLNFQVPLIQIVFDPSTPLEDQDSYISEIFLRLQCGTPLSDGDKYHAATNSPVMLTFSTIEEIHKAPIHRYIGKIGTSKTRSGLPDICGAIMTLGHQNINLLRRSFKQIYPYLKEPFAHNENNKIFFPKYFELLDRVVPSGKINNKIYGKISGFFGYSVLEFTTHKIDATRESFPSPHLEWFLRKLVNDKDYKPTTFLSLTDAQRRNNGPESISARLSAIKTAYIEEQEHTDETESDSDSD